MTPTNIQLAVQGGGAKLCDLLAVMHAAQLAQRAGSIRVTRLAGTSAGAIAAALFAADVDFKVLRERLKANRTQLQAMVPPPGVGMLGRVLLGKAAVNPEPLRRQLAKLLEEHKVSRFSDLTTPLIVLSSDLSSRSSHPHHEADADVAHAVMSSCALPFYFRGPAASGSSPLLVDGGICENFPVEVLRAFESDDGEVLGISFLPGASRETPRSLLGLGMALVDTAMENSVRRSQRQLGPDRLLMLRGDIGTFEFGRALAEGLESRYDLRMREATDFFTQAASRIARRVAVSTAVSTTAAGTDVLHAAPVTTASTVIDPVERPAVPSVVVQSGPGATDSMLTLQRLAELYEVQHAHRRLAFQELRLVVKLRSLVGTAHNGKARPDGLAYRLVFRAATEPLNCIRIGVREEPGSRFDETLRSAVLDRAGTERRTIDLMGRSRDTPNRRDYLLFLNPPIEPEDPAGPFVLDYRHEVTGLTDGLRGEAGVDTISATTHSASGITPKISLLAVLPNGCKKGWGIRASNDTTSKERGRTMTPDELHHWETELALDVGDTLLGWVGFNIEPDVEFAADVFAAGR